MADSNFAFIDPVSAVYYGGSGWLRAYQNDNVIDNYVEPAGNWRTHTAPMDNIICTKNLHHIVCLQWLEVFVAFLKHVLYLSVVYTYSCIKLIERRKWVYI